MTPRDHTEREIVRLHAEGCSRKWIMQHLKVTKSRMDELSLDFSAHGGRRELPCSRGHNATLLGHRNGCCVRCGEALQIPARWVFRDDGTIRALKSEPSRAQLGREIPDQRTDQILALEVERESTPRHLRGPIDEQLRRLRA